MLKENASRVQSCGNNKVTCGVYISAPTALVVTCTQTSDYCFIMNWVGFGLMFVVSGDNNLAVPSTVPFGSVVDSTSWQEPHPKSPTQE